MNLLYVYEYYAPHIGGGEVALQQLAEGMAKKGHTVRLVTSRLPGTKANEILNSVHIHRVWVPTRGSRYWFIFFAYFAVFTQAKQADLIHTFTYTAVLPSWIAAKLRRKKIVLTVHEYWGKLWMSFSGLSSLSALLHRWFERMLFYFPMNQWIAISHATEKNIRELGVPQNKLSVIYQGIDQAIFHLPGQNEITTLRSHMHLSPDTFVYLFFGRPGISKGVEYLLKSVPSITQHMPNSQLWLILAHEPKKEYQRMLHLIQELQIGSSIRIIDSVERNQLPTYIAAAQAVVVPSLSEGFGFSVAETCAVGTPIVATTVGSIPEVVSGHHVLVEPAKPEAIADGLFTLQAGQGNKTPIKNFSWEENIQRHQTVYLHLTS